MSEYRCTAAAVLGFINDTIAYRCASGRPLNRSELIYRLEDIALILHSALEENVSPSNPDRMG